MPEDVANLEAPYSLDWRGRRHGFSDSGTGTHRCTLCGQHADAIVHEEVPEIPDVAGAVRIMERGMILLALLFTGLAAFVVWRQTALRQNVNGAIDDYVKAQRATTCAQILHYPRNPATLPLLEQVYEQNQCHGTLTNPTGPPVHQSPAPVPSVPSALAPGVSPTPVVVVVPGPRGPVGPPGPIGPPGPVVTIPAGPSATASPPRGGPTPTPSPQPPPRPSPSGQCVVNVIGVVVCVP